MQNESLILGFPLPTPWVAAQNVHGQFSVSAITFITYGQACPKYPK